MKKEFDFSKEFAKIDEKLVESAGKEWNPQKHSVFQLYSRKIAGVAILVMVCMAVVSSSTVQAMVKGFTTKIGEVLGFTKDLSSYAEIMNRKQTKGEIALTLKEVIVDDRVLMISVYAEFDEEEQISLWVNEEKTLINGQHHMTYESLQAAGDDGGIFEPAHDMVLVQVYEDQILPEGEVKVHLVLEAGKMEETALESDISFDGDEEFVYDFIITPEELKAQTVNQEIDVTVAASRAGRRDLVFKELTMNDLYCRMTATGVTWDDQWVNEYDLKLKGTDSLGNPVALEGGRFLSENEMLFVTDFFGDYEEGVAIEDEDFRMSVPDRNCEYLDLQLYERKRVWDIVEEVQDEDEEYGTQTIEKEGEAYAGKENYGWEPVGEPFRIMITRNQ